MKIKKYLLYVLPILIIPAGCYLSRKLTTTKRVYINEDFSVTIQDVYNAKYINYTDADTYKSKFLESLKNCLSTNNLILMNEAETDPDFIIEINEFTLQETTTDETVDDPESEFHGEHYHLHSCDGNATITIYSGKGNRMIKQISVWAGKEEKVSNNRNVGDLIFGTNKDNTTYRHKLLMEDVFITLSDKCGYRSCCKITKKLSRYMKK